jgi:hypothetical protein
MYNSHTWLEKGNYNIRVKAKDQNGIQSDWSESLYISMPLNQKINLNLFFKNLIEFINIYN